jgi:RNA-directed DNA polymerase
MIHKHPNQRKGSAMKTKWNNEFFAMIGLIPSYWYYYHKIYGYTLESYILRMKEKQQNKQEKRILKAIEKGQEYYTPDRVRKIKYAQRLATY